MGSNLVRFIEFISFILLAGIAAYTFLVARYRHALVGRKRALYGLGWIALLICINRLMLLWSVLPPETVVAYSGLVIFGLIFWVISEAKKRL